MPTIPEVDGTSGGGSVNCDDDNMAKLCEIYTYEAPWDTYSLGWSVRYNHPYRLAVGSFIQEYSNKVEIIQLNEVCLFVARLRQHQHLLLERKAS